jgi:hypothetical protein
MWSMTERERALRTHFLPKREFVDFRVAEEANLFLEHKASSTGVPEPPILRRLKRRQPNRAAIPPSAENFFIGAKA